MSTARPGKRRQRRNAAAAARPKAKAGKPAPDRAEAAIAMPPPEVPAEAPPPALAKAPPVDAPPLATPPSAVSPEAPARRMARAPALASWEPRHRPGAAGAAAWSRAVRVLKYALPAAALALVAGVFAFTSGTVPATPVSIAIGNGTTISLDPALSSPRLTTRVDGRPLSVTARNAVQIEGDPQRWRLHRIEGSLALAEGRTLGIDATAADIDGRAQSATLAGGIVIVDSGGYRLETNTAAADLRAGRLWSNTPVRGQGPVGSIEAGAFEIYRDGRVSFTGGVRTVFTPKPGPEAGPDGGAAATPVPPKAAEAAATPGKETEAQ